MFPRVLNLTRSAAASEAQCAPKKLLHVKKESSFFQRVKRRPIAEETKINTLFPKNDQFSILR